MAHNTEWDATGSTSTRATRIVNASTASYHVLVSSTRQVLSIFWNRNNYWILDVTHDDMYIRWYNQESINQSDSYTVTATSTDPAHKDSRLTQRSWELNDVPMLFMYGPILVPVE